MFKTHILSGSILAGLLLLFSQIGNAQLLYQPGVHYKEIDQPLSDSIQDGRVKILEVFWYGCPHCNALQPHMQRWKNSASDRAVVEPVPAVVSPRWVFHGQAYYALKAIGADDLIHQAFFDAIHRERNPMNNKKVVTKWAKEKALNTEDLEKAFDSFTVKSNVDRARSLARRLRIASVPTLIVGGRYMTSATMAGGTQSMFALVDYLVDQILANAKEI